MRISVRNYFNRVQANSMNSYGAAAPRHLPYFPVTSGPFFLVSRGDEFGHGYEPSALSMETYLVAKRFKSSNSDCGLTRGREIISVGLRLERGQVPSFSELGRLLRSIYATRPVVTSSFHFYVFILITPRMHSPLLVQDSLLVLIKLRHCPLFYLEKSQRN